MPQIELNLRKSLFVPKFYPYLLDYSHRWEFYMGSAGSAKSYFITQKILVRCINERIKVLVCRRYGTTIRNTCFSLFKDILEKWQLTPFVKINQSDFRIVFPNGSEIIFMGLDEETKLLSLNNIGTIFIEEAYEVPQSIVEQLNLRMRGNVPNQQILMAWNPISKNSWLYEFSVVKPPENSIFIHSTYRDNPFLNKAYIDTLEELYVRNPQKARIFCEGEWGINTDNLVFHNWRVEEFDVLTLAASGLEHRAGADFGYVDPTTVIDSLYDAENKCIYVFNEFYKRGCQLDEVAAAMNQMDLHKVKIFMDAAEPRSIDFFRKQGFNAVPCIKGQNSVKARISFLQNQEIIISPACQNLITEFENFSYLLDKKTEQLTEDTTHEFSHGIDGLGYAYSDIYTKSKLKSFDKALLGL